MRGGLLVACVLVLAACTGVANTSPTNPPTSTVAVTTPTSTLPPVVDCPGVGEFVEGGGVADIDGEGSDSTRLGRVSWKSSEQCESFEFEFETSEGAPATMIPDVEIEYLDSLQVIRLRMGIGSASLVDQLVETDFVERLYVVRALGGDMFVDLHLAEPVAARARVTSEPARLSLDLRPGFLEFAGTSATSDLIVVVSPVEGEEVDPDVTVSGYARTFESNVNLTVTQDEAIVLETFTTAADSVSTWGEYELEATLPSGSVQLNLGDESANLTINLTVR